MRISCPACSSQYDVPDRMLAPGRKVRCAKCGNQWVPEAASEPIQSAAPTQTPTPSPAVDATARVGPPAPAPAAPLPQPSTVPPPAKAPAPPAPPPPAIGESARLTVSPAPRPAPPPIAAPLRSPAPAGAIEPPPKIDDLQPPPPRPPEARRPLAMDLLDKPRVSEPVEPARLQPRRSASTVLLGWIVSLVIWGLVVWAAYTYRFQLMDAWPPIRRLYAAFGLGPGS